MPFSESSLRPIYQLQYKEHSSALPTDQLNAPRTIGPRSRLGNTHSASVYSKRQGRNGVLTLGYQVQDV